MSNNMTFKRQFENYRPNEYINAVRLGFNNEVTFISVPGEEYHSGPNEVTHLPPEQFATGPIIDRLAAYERTYMEPEEILDMKAEWACMKDKIKVLEKEIEAWKTDAKKWENRYTNAKVKFIEENSELKKELKEVKQDTQKWIDNRQGIRVEYDKVLHELTAVKDELAEARNIIKNREAEIVALDDLVESKDKEIYRLHQNLNNIDGPRKYFEEKCALLEKENEALNGELKYVRKRLGETKDKAIRLENENEALEITNKNLGDTITALEKYIENQKQIKKIRAQVLNSVYGVSAFRGGAVYPKFPVDINDLIAKLREHKDIMVSVSQYDDSVTVNVTPWTPVTEEEEKK